MSLTITNLFGLSYTQLFNCCCKFIPRVEIDHLSLYFLQSPTKTEILRERRHVLKFPLYSEENVVYDYIQCPYQKLFELQYICTEVCLAKIICCVIII